MAEKLMTEIQDDFLTCHLCQKPYQNPKALPCLHSFCRQCLDAHLKGNAVRAANDGTQCMFCPVCKQVVEVPSKAGVDGFADNHLLKQLLDMMYSRALQLCDICKDEGKCVGAGFCCIKCEDFLCPDCAANHKRTRVTRDHLVINVSMMKDICLGKHKQSKDSKIYVRVLTKIGSFGPDLFNPIAVTTNRADDLIVSNNNDKITVFSQAGECKKSLDQRLFYGSENIFLPNRGLAVTTEGFLAVAIRKDITSSHAYIGLVQTLAGREAGIFSLKLRSPKDATPHGIAVTLDNYTIITDISRHCFYIFNPDMELVKQVGKRGKRSSQFKTPFFVTVSSKNDILISDYDNHCIKVFDMKGKFRYKFGKMGRELGDLMHPVGICTDSEDNVFVCDRDNHRVQMYSSTGKFVTVICQNTCKDGNDVRPQDVTMTSNGHLVVLVKGVEGVDVAELHVLQVGTSRFSTPEHNVSEAREQLSQLRRSMEAFKQPTPQHRAGTLPPLGLANKQQPSAPALGRSKPPDLVPYKDKKSYLYAEGGIETVNPNAFPHAPRAGPEPSSVCTIL